MFIKFAGKTKNILFKRPASQAFGLKALVNFDGSGLVIPADATSGDHLGVIQEEVLTTDDNYADSDVFVEVEVPVERFVEYVVPADGTAVATDIGKEIDLTDSLNANRAASSKDALLVTRFRSATELVVIILSMVDNKNTVTT